MQDLIDKLSSLSAQNSQEFIDSFVATQGPIPTDGGGNPIYTPAEFTANQIFSYMKNVRAAHLVKANEVQQKQAIYADVETKFGKIAHK